MKPFEHEARRLLGEALFKLNPHPMRKPMADAADALLKELIALAQAQGLEAGQVENGSAFYVSASSSFSVRLMTDGETFMLQRYQYRYVGEPRRAQLAYDCVTKSFCGTEVDSDVAPTPGERLPRVNALVVLARLTAELLTTTTDG
jgi:hypothetical protein